MRRRVSFLSAAGRYGCGAISLRNPGGYQFDEKVAEHRELLRLILGGSDQEIDAGFRRLFDRFLSHVLTRFREDTGVTPAMAADPSAN